MEFEFSEREQCILKLLIDRYIELGQPVGSRTLSRLPGIDISAASVRNVMGDLEQMGLLKSPHTSAGRVPTSAAWRVFVDRMLEVQPVDMEIIRSMQSALDPALSDQNLMRITSTFLSGFTRMAGMVTVPRRDEKPMQQIEFIPLSERRVLAIIIINDKEVQNRIIHVERDYTKDELDELSRYLSAEYLGKPLQAVRDLVHADLKRTHEHMSRLMQLMIDVAGKVFDADSESDSAEDTMVFAGETNLMDHADLSDINTLRELFDAFQRKRDIYHLLERCLAGEGVQIYIGRESGYDALGECSLVTAPYEVDGKVLGVLGVVGPKRMAYSQVVPVVDMTSKLLSAALNSRNQA